MEYEIIVVGGGHAGCEASLAAARKNHKTLLITGNIKNIADMPCNPSIGGPAKGIVVREIDALGGEMGRNADKAALQMKMLKPKLIILDELDSGLDVDSLKIVCDNINNYLKENKDTSILMITHYPRILEYIKPDYIHVLKDGKIVETGDITLAEKIDKFGYGIFNN